MGEVELGLKQSFQEEKETSRAGNGRNGAVFAADESFVDQFLNLQNADDNPQEADFPENLQISTKAYAFRPPPPPIASVGEDLCSALAFPEEEPELEWLSQFMEDSFSPPYPAGAGIPPRPEHKTRPARSKRHLSGHGPGWPISSSSATESTTSSSSSSSATSPPCQPTLPSTPLETQTRRPRHRPATLARMCSHCGSQKTPQWRAGPTGKTLCNACGVRFKSGRLFPEYRPASSPTFSSEAHSNSHKKVLEMRKKKQKMGQAEPGFKPGLTSFG